jgi:hypothetical protein
LLFDTLEDRRLLAGLNISIFEDANGTGAFEADADIPVAFQVAYLDSNQNGSLDSNEQFAISDSNGSASFESLENGSYWVRVLGKPNELIPVVFNDEVQQVNLQIPVELDPDNTAPAWSVNSIDIDGTEDTMMEISSMDLLPFVENEIEDANFYFVTSKPTHGDLIWSLTNGGHYVPDTNYFGSDSYLVKIFDGQSWSDELLINVQVAAVDDLPTALRVTFAESVPENTPNALLGTYEIDDVDGGLAQFSFGSQDMYEASGGEIRLRGDMTLDFEKSSSFSVGLSLVGQTQSSQYLTASATLPVTDENDPSSGIQFIGVPEVMEFRKGAKFGTLRVLDEDANDQYTWQLSDNRFYVDEGNNLRLLADTYLATRDQTSLPLVLTATSGMGGDAVESEITIKVNQAPPSYQNPSFPLDVNNDGNVTALDVLAIVNRFNGRGSRDLSGPPPSGHFDYVDVNGDRALTALDVLVVINYLNSMRRSGGSAEGGPREQLQRTGHDSLENSQLNDLAQQMAAAQSTEYQQKLRRSLLPD